MDTGKGKFEMLNVESENLQAVKNAMEAMEKKHPNHGGWFRVGETIEIRGSLFTIKTVKPTQIVLKLKRRNQ